MIQKVVGDQVMYDFVAVIRTIIHILYYPAVLASSTSLQYINKK